MQSERSVAARPHHNTPHIAFHTEDILPLAHCAVLFEAVAQVTAVDSAPYPPPPSLRHYSSPAKRRSGGGGGRGGGGVTDKT